MTSWGAALAALLALAGCARPAPRSDPHYVAGGPWQAEGVWHYPSPSFELNQTGLAEIYAPAPPPLTADGEAFDPAALTAAHQTLQLPAIVWLTNLQSGLQTRVRINDRGPANPARILAVTPRVASLLAFPPDGVARVRLEVLQAETREAAGAIRGGEAARLDIATAPRPVVRQEALPALAGTRQAGQPAGSLPPAGNATVAVAVTPAMRPLPEAVTRVAPEPGQLWLLLGSFSRAEFARMQLARIGGLGARIERIRNGRTFDFRVILGPYSRVSEADAAVRRVIAAGVNDARIRIE